MICEWGGQGAHGGLPRPPCQPHPDLALLCLQSVGILVMEDCNVHSAASILASVKEQEARFERLTRALEQERRHVALQLERAQQPGVGSGQPVPMAWQQLVLQVRANNSGSVKMSKWGNKSPGGPQASVQWLIAKPPGASREGAQGGQKSRLSV